MSTQPIDYAALAKKYGGTSSAPGAVDYAALAKQNGAISSTPPPQPAAEQPPEKSWAARAWDTVKGAATYEKIPWSPLAPSVYALKANQAEADKMVTDQINAGHPIRAGIASFLAGANRTVGNIVGSANSPVGVAITAAPVLGTAGKLAAATGGFGMSVGELGPNRPGETTPDTIERNLLASAGVVGSAAGIGETVKPALNSVASKVRAPLSKTMTTPRSAIPADAVTPSEIKAYAQENSIGPLTAAQITEHNLPRHIQTAGERAGIGGTQIRQNVRAGQASVAQHASDLMDRLSPDTPTSTDQGAAIKTGIQEALERERENSNQNFAAIDQKAEGVVVDFRPLKQLAGQLLNDSSFIRDNLKTADPKRMSNILRDVTNLPEQGTFSQAQAVRSTLFDESNHPDMAISSQAQAAIKRLTSATHEQMAAAAETNPGLMTAFENASSHWRAMHDVFNNPRSPVAQALAELDPNKVTQKFTAKGQSGGSPFNVEMLDGYGIDKSPVKRAILQDIYNRNFHLYGRTLGGYSHEFLSSVFTPEELQSIYKTGAISRSVGLNVNPPNTAETLDAIGGDSGATKRVFLKTGKAALTKADWFNDWLTNEGSAGATPSRGVPSASGPAGGTAASPAPVRPASIARGSKVTREAMPQQWSDVPSQFVAEPPAPSQSASTTESPRTSNEAQSTFFRGPDASQAVPDQIRPDTTNAAGTETRVRVPGENRSYEARYQVRELDDVRASHSGITFQPNQKYALVNDRNYSNPVNQAKVFTNAQQGVFDPTYHITDNPDATNGPIVIDSEGHALGGNGRAMILERVYKHNPSGAEAYRQLLMQKAQQFGVDPQVVQDMKRPVLVREIADAEFDQPSAKQNAVTDFNKKGTAELTPAERAVADSRRVSQEILDDVAARLDAKGPDATLSDVLRDKSGAQVLDRLISEGIISPQERAAYADLNGLTEAGKQRVSKLLTARFFRDPAQIDSTPASIQNKLERVAAPLARVDGMPGWDITPHMQEALGILEELRSRGLRNIDDLTIQQGLWGNSAYSPEAVALAKHLQSTSPTELAKAARQYSLDAADSDRPLLGGSMVSPEQAFKDAFGEVRNRKNR
jgi:ddrB-like ParB superfamily domain